MDNKECKELMDIIGSIKTCDGEAKQKALKYADSLVKPPRSMGKLEDIAASLSGITGCVKNTVSSKRVLVFCADNGVTDEGVASAPVSVTMMQAINMTKGITGMAALAKHFGADVTVVDVGIKAEYEGLVKKCDLAHADEGIVYRNIRKGTGNIAKEPAMTEAECIRAMLVGAECAMNIAGGSEFGDTILQGEDAHFKGKIDLVGIGEMGIGNTTTSTAVLCALTGVDPDSITGRGAGITDESFDKKKAVIKKALGLHGLGEVGCDSKQLDSSPEDRLGSIAGIVSKVGGLDIAAMCGAFIGAAAAGRAAVIDGYISAVAALLSVKLCPKVSGYLLPSHVSKEPGYLLAIKELGLNPYLDLNMGLGEGSGCVVAFSVIEAACAMMNNMATFEEGKIDDSYLEGIR
ncbi:nicotinate-nucleotide--dimethylbenzimidazole phosphoribosyltransferase [Butyrivibrio sp. X503]|uniref:nicotinate-nucleotide--dimethylbenzimidazole phosphoribosyltransferase n=1 Tax=Butyrivibrio sp. X503 TaxID=2364878 RepID=UPI000EA98D73|nr:nicotinate-nucleotide--dimethylbenzimidazole phosphoribosyltransferase [Butyrivibrio sp. X503]RKM58332.1 nicotinate-nucleotide--dimethylbenzimidazole phosphoribosyltransferase [Butyrivibrio sp. X503]